MSISVFTEMDSWTERDNHWSYIPDFIECSKIPPENHRITPVQVIVSEVLSEEELILQPECLPKVVKPFNYLRFVGLSMKVITDWW